MREEIIRRINQALYFMGGKPAPVQAALRPWQYVQMEYERVGLVPPAVIPSFDSIEDAQIWMCLDAEYNLRLREISWPQAV